MTSFNTGHFASDVARAPGMSGRQRLAASILAAGTVFGITQTGMMYAKGERANDITAATLGVTAFMGVGLGALLLKQVHNPTVNRLLTRGGTAAALAGAAFIGSMAMAPAARADLSPNDPYYSPTMGEGTPTLPGKVVRSSEGIKIDKLDPNMLDKDVEDLTEGDGSGKVPNSSERLSGFIPAREADGSLVEGTGPNFIVLKATGDGSAAYDAANPPAANGFLDAYSGTNSDSPSTHFVVDKAGNVAMYVHPDRRAAHTTGKPYPEDHPLHAEVRKNLERIDAKLESLDPKKDQDEIAELRAERIQAESLSGWNSASISISLVNDNTGTEYTYEQMEAARELVQQLSAEYQIPVQHVLMDKQVQGDVSPGPVGFPWGQWVDSLDDEIALDEATNKDGTTGIPKLDMSNAPGNTSSTNNAVQEAHEIIDASEAGKRVTGGQEADNGEFRRDSEGPSTDAGNRKRGKENKDELEADTNVLHGASSPQPAPDGELLVGDDAPVEPEDEVAETDAAADTESTDESSATQPAQTAPQGTEQEQYVAVVQERRRNDIFAPIAAPIAAWFQSLFAPRN